jgi:hypothetical protein
MSRGMALVLLLCSVFSIEAAHAQRTPRQSLPSLSVSDGRVTADVNRSPLRVVIEELARHVPVRASLADAAREHLVTAHFSALPLNEALARLLTGLPYAVVMPNSAQSGTTPALIEVFVFDKAPEQRTVVKSETSAGTIHTLPAQNTMPDVPPEWSAALRHPDRAVRVEALERWATQGAGASLNPLTEALVDPDESVRARAQELVERVLSAN